LPSPPIPVLKKQKIEDYIPSLIPSKKEREREEIEKDRKAGEDIKVLFQKEQFRKEEEEKIEEKQIDIKNTNIKILEEIKNEILDQIGSIFGDFKKKYENDKKFQSKLESNLNEAIQDEIYNQGYYEFNDDNKIRIKQVFINGIQEIVFEKFIIFNFDEILRKDDLNEFSGGFKRTITNMDNLNDAKNEFVKYLIGNITEGFKDEVKKLKQKELQSIEELKKKLNACREIILTELKKQIDNLKNQQRILESIEEKDGWKKNKKGKGIFGTLLNVN
jgi:hypothetical protein